MSETLARIRTLIQEDSVRISEHGYDELADDDLSAREIIEGVEAATAIEDYPTFPKGPCVLVLQRDSEGKPVHVVWGIPAEQSSPAVLVTAYRPDSERWTDNFTRRKT